MKALSIRQPWAWLIVNGFKDIENRDWRSEFRGPFFIHASKGMRGSEYEECRDFAAQHDILIPEFDDLERGGIIGRATMLGCLKNSSSPWFFGKYGYLIIGPQKLPFTPLKGQLGFFEVDPRIVDTLAA